MSWRRAQFYAQLVHCLFEDVIGSLRQCKLSQFPTLWQCTWRDPIPLFLHLQLAALSWSVLAASLRTRACGKHKTCLLFSIPHSFPFSLAVRTRELKSRDFLQFVASLTAPADVQGIFCMRPSGPDKGSDCMSWRGKERCLQLRVVSFLVVVENPSEDLSLNRELDYMGRYLSFPKILHLFRWADFLLCLWTLRSKVICWKD